LYLPFRFIGVLEKEMTKSNIFATDAAYKDFLDMVDTAAEDGSVSELEKYVEEADIRNLRRTKTSDRVLIPDMILVDTYWNALHIALFNGKADAAKFILEDCRIDATSSLRLARDQINFDRSRSVDYEVFPILLTILNKDVETAGYLWIDHEYYWNQDHLKAVINLIEDKNYKEGAGIMLNNKTSHDIFAYLNLDEKLKLMEWLASDDRKYANVYKKALLQKPYRWVYLLFRSKNIDEIDEDEARELKKVGDDIKVEELEIKEDDKTEHLHTFIKNLTQVEEEDDGQFEIYKSVTSKLVKNSEFEKYKAEDSEEKLLTEVDEDEEENQEVVQDEEEDESDFSDEDFEFPENEEICQWAGEGKLKRLQKVVAHKEFIDLNLIKGYETQVSIDEEEYNTELWNPLVFAINANKIKVVKYFLEEAKINTRLAFMNPDKQDEEYQEEEFFGIEPTDEIQNLFIPVQNNHLEMFKLLWNSNFAVWTEDHLLELLKEIVRRSWGEGLLEFMKARNTREIFISLTYNERNKLFDEILEIAEDIDDEGVQELIYDSLAESPYSLAMVVAKFDDKEMDQYIEKALGNFKEPEYNFIIFSEEVDTYIKALEGKSQKEIAEELKRYQGFMQTHYKIGINNAAITILTPKSKEVELFKKEPKYAHLNLHAIALSNQNKVVWPHVKDKAALKFFKGYRWDLLSLALYSQNTDIFNSLIRDTQPLTSMIFKLENDEIIDSNKNEYISKLQALIQHSKNIDVLFNSLENHSSLFKFAELYSIVKNVLTNGDATQVKILNSRAIKSWFAFMNDESKIKFIEEMFDFADENKATFKELGKTLLKPLYSEYFERADEEKFNQFSEGEVPDNEKSSEPSEAESDSDNESAKDANASSSEESGDAESASESSDAESKSESGDAESASESETPSKSVEA
jgi:ankyrin repeat protein